MKKFLFALLPLLFLTLACHKSEPTYSGIEAGLLSSRVFTSDSGTQMNVVGNEGNFDVNRTRRVLISYRTRPLTDAGRFDVDILGLWEASILAPSAVDSMPDGPDGASIEGSDAGFGGGYLNLLVSYQGDDASLHTLATTYKADPNGIVVRLHHDGSKDQAPANKVFDMFLSIPMDEPCLSYDQQSIAVGKKQIEIDVCGSCRAVWYDKGEFEAITPQDGLLNATVSAGKAYRRETALAVAADLRSGRLQVLDKKALHTRLRVSYHVPALDIDPVINTLQSQRVIKVDYKSGKVTLVK